MTPPHPYAQLHPGDSVAVTVTAGLLLHGFGLGRRLIEAMIGTENHQNCQNWQFT
jgi:hypothetical protein